MKTHSRTLLFFAFTLLLPKSSAMQSSATAAASVNVADFGPVGTGSSDDAKVIQTAIDAAPSGASVIFPAREYQLRRPLLLRSHRSYQGTTGAIIHAPAGDFAALSDYDAATAITIDGLTFDGGGVHFTGQHVPAQAIRVSNCAFTNIQNSGPNWPVHNGLFFPSGLRDGIISGNRFYNILDGGSTDPNKALTANGILVYHGLERTSVVSNVFERVQQGMYIQFTGDGPYRDVTVSGNSGTKVHRMGIELQGGGTTNLVIEDNYFTDFLDPNPGTFGISVAVDGGSNSVVRNNTLIATPPATTNTQWGTRYGIGIEIGGKNAQLSGNYVAGGWEVGIAIGNAPTAHIRDNYLCGSPGSRSIRHETSLMLDTALDGNTAEPACKPPKSAGGLPPAHTRTF